MGKIDFGKAFSRGWEIFSGNMINYIIGFFLAVLISITVILAPIMFAGFYFMLIKGARGESVEIGDVFHGFSDFGRYFIGGLLYLGIMLLGALACGVGIIPVAGIMLFFYPLMVDKGLGAGEAFSKCWEYFKTDWLMAILLAIVTGIVSQAGSYVMGIGVLFTGPFASAVMIGAYEHVFGETATPVAAPAAPAPPAAPAAEPTPPPPPPADEVPPAE